MAHVTYVLLLNYKVLVILLYQVFQLILIHQYLLLLIYHLTKLKHGHEVIHVFEILYK